MTITAQALSTGIIGYKCAAYSAFSSHTYVTTADDSQDWSGLYVAPNRSVAKTYGVDYVDEKTGSGTAYLHEVHLLRSATVLVCDDKRIGDGAIDKLEKKKIIISQLPSGITVKSTGLLIPQLGALGYFYQGFHDEDDMELIVPNALCNSVSLILSRTYTYKKYERSGKIKH